MKKDLLKVAALVVACTFLGVQAFAGNGTPTKTATQTKAQAKLQTKIQSKDKVQSRLKSCQ